MPTIELRISGKVQGVFYRASTRKKAESLQLSGWVKNNPDGSVWIRASGSAAGLNAMETWCAKGPDGAVVTEVVRKNLPEESFTGFSIIR